MTKKQRERAVAIAKDALKIIKRKGVSVIASNTYCRSGDYQNFMDGMPDILPEDANLKTFLPALMNPKAPCEVCALGSLFLAHVDLYNKVKIPKEVSNERQFERRHLDDVLSKTFSEEQMCLIEEYFEEYFLQAESGYDEEENPFFKYKDDTERLRAILKNIVRNDGEFVPSDVR